MGKRQDMPSTLTFANQARTKIRDAVRDLCDNVSDEGSEFDGDDDSYSAVSQDDSSYQASDYSDEVGSVDDDVDDSAGDGSLSDENDDDDDNDDDPNPMIHMDPDDNVTSSEDTVISQHGEDIQDEDDEDNEDSHALPPETTGVDEPWDNPTVEVERTGVDDSSVASEPQQPTKEEKFAEAVAVGQADAMKPNTVQPTRNKKKNLDPAFVYLNSVRQAGPQLFAFLTEQMLAKHGLNQFGKQGAGAIMDKLRQLVYRNVMWGINRSDMSRGEIKCALQYLMFLKEKCSGKIKGCGCTNG